MFRLARAFHRIGESARSLATYQQVVGCQPDCAEAYFSMGLLYRQQGNYCEAIRCYRQAVFARPSYVKAHEHLGTALVHIEAYEAADVSYEQAIAACPGAAVLFKDLGHLRLAQGNEQLALVNYRQAIALDPSLSAAYKGIGSLYYRNQSLQQAAHYFQQAVSHAPHSASALSFYTWTLAEQGRWAELLDCFRQDWVAESNFVAAYIQKARALSSALSNPHSSSDGKDDLLFRLQRTCGDFLEALLQTDSDESIPADLLLQLAQVYSCLGDFSSACNAPARAEQCYRFALTIAPKARRYESLGDCVLSQGRRAAAIIAYQTGALHTVEHKKGEHKRGEYKKGEHKKGEQTSAPAPAKTLEKKVTPEEEQTTSCALDSSLAQKLAQTLNSLPTSSAITASGVYRHTQDWLADNGLASARLSAEPGVEASAVNAPDPDCGGLACRKCMNNLIGRYSPAQEGKSTFRCCPAKPDPDLAFSAFVANIPSGRAWIAPQQNGWSACNEIAVFSPDDFLLGDLSRCYPWHLPGCQRHDPAAHTVFQRSVPLPAARQFEGRVAVLSGLSGHIYYHWLFDVLPRFKILQQGLLAEGEATLSAQSNLKDSFEEIDYFVVNSVSKPFQRETLTALGVPLEKVIESDRTPHIQAEELIVPSFAGHMDWVPPSSMDFLRETFLGSEEFRESASRKNPTRLYISRSNAKYRHIFNEAAVIDLLDQYGFVAVNLETLTVAQQVQLFATAEAIVGAHGSGLTNLVFCSPGCSVVELFSPYYLRTDYWMISQYLQLQHYYLVGESFPFEPLRQLMYPSALTEDFAVDVNELRSLLKQLGLTR